MVNTIKLIAAWLLLAAGNLGAVTFITNSMPDNLIMPWYMAGVPGGIPATNATVFTNMNVPADGVTDIGPALASAFSSCPAGQVVFLPAGTYYLGSTIHIPNGVILRGDTNNTTIRINTRLFLGGESYLSGWYDVPIYSGYTAGSTNISVYSTNAAAEMSQFNAGDLVAIDQINDTLTWDGGSDISGWMDVTHDEDGQSRTYAQFNRFGPTTNMPYSGSDPYHVKSGGTYLTNARSMHYVTRIGSITDTTNFTLENPLPIDFKGSLEPYICVNPTSLGGLQHHEGVGLEGIIFDCSLYNPGYSPPYAVINMFRCYASWITDCEFKTWSQYCVTLTASYRCTVKRCYWHDIVPGTYNKYACVLQYSTLCLVEDNAFVRTISNIVGDYPINLCVYAYNFQTNNHYNYGKSFSDATYLVGGMSTHRGGSIGILMEGNRSCGPLFLDDVHQSSGYQTTIFRNRVLGWDHDGTVEKTSQTQAIYISGACPSNVVLGNILGKVDYHNHALSARTGTGYCGNDYVMRMGQGANHCGWTYYDPYMTNYTWIHDTLMLFGGSYHFITDGRWWTNADGTTWGYLNQDQSKLDDSLYLSGKPSWFGDWTWPPYDPWDTNTILNVIPAQARYYAIEPENPVGSSDVCVTPLTFAVTADEGSSSTRQFTVSNCGQGPDTMTYTLSVSNAAWMSVDDVAAGLTPGQNKVQTITYDASALTEGIYTNWITVDAATSAVAVASSPKLITFLLTLTDTNEPVQITAPNEGRGVIRLRTRQP